MFHLFYASQLAKKDILDYITDQIKGDLGSALRAIGKDALQPIIMNKSHTHTQPLPHPTYKPCIHHVFKFQQSIGAETAGRRGGVQGEGILKCL